MTAPSNPYVSHLQPRLREIMSLIRELVERESPSHDKTATDALGGFIADTFRRAGARVTVHSARDFGDHIQADFDGDPSRKPIFLLGHFDSVWDAGTLAKMPFREADDRLWGPGVLDMKCGIAQALYAINAIRDVRGRLPRQVTVFLVTDEEIGSETSRPITERLARLSAAVLVLEPSYGLHGALKTARKGVGEYVLKVKGIASHSGLDFQKGASAVLELSHQLLEIAKLTDLAAGISVNPGVIRGGTRTNVIAPEAEADIDARVTTIAQAELLDSCFRSLKPLDPRCSLQISGSIRRPPMERTEAIANLFAMAQRLGRELSLDLQEAAVGGGSDGNFTAAIGVPTLDGLGVPGEGAHATNESILVDQIVPRTALLARLIEEV